jgi:hypothetical protein
MTPSGPARHAAKPTQSRAIGLAMLGSAIALATLAALAYAGVLPVAEDIRGWMAAGVGLAAVIDALIGVYFLRASSQS